MWEMERKSSPVPALGCACPGCGDGTGLQGEAPRWCPPEDLERGPPAGRLQPSPLASPLGSAGLSPAPILPKTAAPHQTQQHSLFTTRAGGSGNRSRFLRVAQGTALGRRPGCSAEGKTVGRGYTEPASVESFPIEDIRKKPIRCWHKSQVRMPVFYLSRWKYMVPVGNTTYMLLVNTSNA